MVKNDSGYRDVTAGELARLALNNKGRHIDFTFDKVENLNGGEPEGWYGVVYTDPFGSGNGFLMIGYYGGLDSMCFNFGAIENLDPMFYEEKLMRARWAIEDYLYSMSLVEAKTDTVCTDYYILNPEGGE